MRPLVTVLLAIGLGVAVAVPTAACTASAPGAPGDDAVFTPADKQGFGTAL